MRKSLQSIGIALALCVPLGACEREGEQNTASAADADATAIEATIKEKEAQMLRDIQARNVDAVAAHFAEDATMIFPGEPPFRGRDAIAAEMKGLLADPAFAVETVNEKTGAYAGGDLAYTRGSFKVSYTDRTANEVKRETGYYVTVFKRQPDGSWKVVEDISSPGEPAS